jgi:hypothetical protein
MFTVPALRLRCAQSWMREDTMANNPVTRRTALGAAAVGAAAFEATQASLVERGLRIFRRANVGLLVDRLALAGERVAEGVVAAAAAR